MHGVMMRRGVTKGSARGMGNRRRLIGGHAAPNHPPATGHQPPIFFADLAPLELVSASCDARELLDERQEKLRIASRAQCLEILRHRETMSRRLQRAISLDEAARDWIRRHAAEWRARFEANWHRLQTSS